MQAGDDVLVLADPDETAALERYFTDPAPIVASNGPVVST